MQVLISVLTFICSIILIFFTKRIIIPFIQLKLYHEKFKKDTVLMYIPVGEYQATLLKNLQYYKDSDYTIKQIVKQNPDKKILLHSILGRPMLMLLDSTLMQEVWQNPDNYRKLKPDFTSHHVLDKGIFSTEHEQWKCQRQLIAGNFSFEKIQKFMPIIDIAAQRGIKKLQTYANGKQKVPIIQHCMSIASQVIFESFFGFDIDKKRANDKPASKEVIDIVNDSIKLSYTNVYMRLKRFILGENCQSYSQFYCNDEILLQQRLKNVREAISSVIELRVELFIKNKKEGKKTERNDILDIYINLYLEGKCTIDEIVSQSINFVFVGQDPIGVFVGTVLYYLAKNQSKQLRLRRDVFMAKQRFRHRVSGQFRQDKYEEDNEEAYEEHQTSSKNSINTELLKVEYLQAIINETLRIQSPANMMVYRVAEKDHMIGKFPIKKGWVVNTSMQAANLNPKHYHNVNEFMPERWLGIEKQNIDKKIFSPFSNGPRNCLGAQFAQLEAKIVILHFIKNFKILENEDLVLSLNQQWVYAPVNQDLILLDKINEEDEEYEMLLRDEQGDFDNFKDYKQEIINK